jgi:hypothetical protein
MFHSGLRVPRHLFPPNCFSGLPREGTRYSCRENNLHTIINRTGTGSFLYVNIGYPQPTALFIRCKTYLVHVSRSPFSENRTPLVHGRKYLLHIVPVANVGIARAMSGYNIIILDLSTLGLLECTFLHATTEYSPNYF